MQSCYKATRQSVFVAVSLRLFHRRRTQPRNYHEVFSFLSKDEKVLREPDSKWQVVRHGRRFVWNYGADEFRFGSLRRLLLTDKRLILLKGYGRKDEEKEIDCDIPLDDVRSVEEKFAGGPLTWIPYLRIELKNGEVVSLAFVLAPAKKRPSEDTGSYLFNAGLYLAFDTRSVINRWVKSVNDLVLSRQGCKT